MTLRLDKNAADRMQTVEQTHAAWIQATAAEREYRDHRVQVLLSARAHGGGHPAYRVDTLLREALNRI